MKKIKTTSKVTSTPIPEPSQNVSTTENIILQAPKIGRLHVSGNEDINKMVEKINEIIDKLNVN